VDVSGFRKEAIDVKQQNNEIKISASGVHNTNSKYLLRENNIIGQISIKNG
jgi:HSP20 family molecular chaperone IbpA